MTEAASCLNCGDRLHQSELERGWVASPDEFAQPPAFGPMYFLCSFCRDQVKLEWNRDGTAKRILGPMWRTVA